MIGTRNRVSVPVSHKCGYLYVLQCAAQSTICRGLSGVSTPDFAPHRDRLRCTIFFRALPYQDYGTEMDD